MAEILSLVVLIAVLVILAGLFAAGRRARRLADARNRVILASRPLRRTRRAA